MSMYDEEEAAKLLSNVREKLGRDPLTVRMEDRQIKTERNTRYCYGLLVALLVFAILQFLFTVLLYTVVVSLAADLHKALRPW